MPALPDVPTRWRLLSTLLGNDGVLALVWSEERLNLHFSQDMHLGHGCVVGWPWCTYSFCASLHPKELRFSPHIFQSRKLR